MTQKAAQSRQFSFERERERRGDSLLTESPLFFFSPAPFLHPHSGKAVKDGGTKGETEVKNATAEVKTVPSEAPQTNGNESRA